MFTSWQKQKLKLGAYIIHGMLLVNEDNSWTYSKVDLVLLK